MTDICAFCLSNNRNLYSIRDEHWLSFYSLLDGDDAQYMKYLQTESLLRLCWECQARLVGFTKFVRSAQRCVGILRSYWACPTESLPSSLSNLYQTVPQLTDVSSSLEISSDVAERVKIEFELSEPPELASDKHSIKLENEAIDKESLFEALTEGAGFQADGDDGDGEDDEKKVEGIEQVNLPERNKEGRRKKNVKKKVKVVRSPRTRKTGKTKRYHTTWMSHERARQCYESERDGASAGHTDCNSESAGIYICDMCQHRFDDQPALQRHIAGHYTLYKCRVCDYETRVLADMRAHRTHMREAVSGGKKSGGNVCKKCKISFETASLLRKHRSKCSLFKCDFCDKAFVHRTSKYSHMDLHHKPLPQVECKLCGKQFKNKYAIKSHLQKHRKEARGSNYTCTVCQVDYKTAIAFRQHFYKTVRIDGREEFRNECAHCEIKFSSPKRLQEHISNVHAKKATYRCDKCHKSYMQQKALDAHTANKHQSTKPARDKICDVCGKRFTSTTILRNHMRSHTGEKPYKCTLCGAAFAHTGSLYTHNKLLHKKKKMPHAHVDMQMYQCPDCSKEFVSEARWRSHYDFFHLKKSKYACEICNKIFISAWNLKNHKTMLHGINRTRSFPCNICGKEFFRIDALKSHKLIHSEERTFMCSECGKTFKQQAALYTHTKLVHKGIKRPPAKPSTTRVKKPAVGTQMELEAKFV